METIRRGNSATPSLSILMLVSDGERWERFMPGRLEEMRKLAATSPFPFEVVFVVNGACDREQLIVQLDAAPFPFTLVLHERNHIPRARNLAAEIARGTYVLVWDDDDTLLTPAGVPELLAEYQVSRAAVLCAEMRLADGTPLHPQGPADMPQQPREHEGVLFTGMQHTPFIARRSIVATHRLSEVRLLRGEWVEWSARLWRAGLPIGYSLRTPCTFQDQSGKGRRATRCPEAFAHVLVSMLCLSYEYGIEADTFAADVLYRRYCQHEFERCCPDPRAAWARLLEVGRTLEDAERLAASFESEYDSFRAAWDHVMGSREALALGRERIGAERRYDVPPFGIFAAGHEHLLQDCLEQAPARRAEFA